MRKFAKIFLRGVIVSVSRLFLGIKKTEIYDFVLAAYLRSPFSIVSKNSLITTSVDFPFSAICRISRTRGFSEIVPAVVQSVAIFVIHELLRETKNLSGHSDTSLLSGETYCVKTSSTFIPMGRPIPLIQPIIVGRIYDRILSLCQWNQSVGLIERLDNFVSANTAFRHESSMKGFVLQPHSIIGGV
jgi:hypothetical protein